MELASLAWRTDLALLQYAGSEVEDRDDHLVVRTPLNPGYYWGNFLLFNHPPGPDEVPDWLDLFARELPEAKHRAFGVDGTTGTRADLAPLEAAGFSGDASSVMTARSVHEPARPNTQATIRTLVSDDDWEQQVRLALAGENLLGGLEFAIRKAEAHRLLTEQGRGRWFGAFLGARLLCSLGLFAASEGLARFQDVKTHPDARGQGLAGTLVHTASRHGLDELGATTLVMVADPDYLAIRIYRSVGFTYSETQLGAELPPPH